MIVRGFPSRCGAHRLAVLFAFAIAMLAPSIRELDHALHAPAAATVHDEASHPDAAPHLEQEEHLGKDECLVCLHADTKLLEPRQSSDPLVDSSSGDPVSSLAPAGSTPRTSDPARAPPA